VLTRIESDFTKNVSPQRSAVFAAAAVLTDQVEMLQIDRRLLTLRQIQQLDVRQFQAHLHDTMAGKDTLSDEIFFGTVVIGVALVRSLSPRRDGKWSK